MFPLFVIYTISLIAMFSHLILVTCFIVPTARASGWDDFTDNLATDLVGRAFPASHTSIGLTLRLPGSVNLSLWRETYNPVSLGIY